MLTGTACAAQDVDLLTYDPIPQKKESDAPPVDVLPPEVKLVPKPAPVAPPVEKIEQPAPQAVPATPPSRPQPPVEVAKPKPAEPAAKKVDPPVVKPEPKPEVVVTPPPTAALPKAAEGPAVRPVLKVTEPDLKQGRPDRTERPSRVEKEVKKDVMRHAGPKPVVVPPPTLNADIDPVHPEDLHDKATVRAVQEEIKVEPPPAPEALVKVKDGVIQLGDPIKIEVAGESDLSGWYKVSNDGSVVLPIIGKVRAQGFTHAKLAEILTDTLKDGYLVNPVVTVTGKAAP